MLVVWLVRFYIFLCEETKKNASHCSLRGKTPILSYLDYYASTTRALLTSLGPRASSHQVEKAREGLNFLRKLKHTHLPHHLLS